MTTKEKKWKVRGGFMFPKDRANNIYLEAGSVFTATDAEVEPYHWMVEEVEETKKQPPAEESETAEEKDPPRRKRGRPPKFPRAFAEPPEDRAY